VRLKGRVTGLVTVVTAAALVSACAAPSPGAANSPGATAISRPGTARIPALKELTGLQPPEILAMLGQPDLRRDEPPAEMWQYRAADCVLNLFFYEESGSYRLTHSETWQRSLAGGSAPASCRDENAPLKAHLVRSDL
jgi:hypothetical protein